MNNLTILDNYNILDLIGLSGITDERKNKLLERINTFIWQEFIVFKFTKLLTPEELKYLEDLAQKQHDTSKMLAYISSKVPNFTQLFEEYKREAKVKIIHHQIDDVLQDIHKTIESQTKEVQQILIAKKAKYQKAKQLAAKENWEELKKVMSP